jgi:nitrogen fixation NifU-like protein
MTDLRELYQEMILDHGRRPRNFGELPEANRHAEGYNPLCGDMARVFLNLDGEVVKDARFLGKGCSISTASASMMTEAVKGKTLAEIEALFTRFHGLVTGTAQGVPELGKLAVFAGVSEFPARVKCASLPWHTMKAALDGSREPVSTE